MPRYRKTTISGDVIEIEEFTRPEVMDKCHRRGANVSETEAGKEEYNRRQAVRKLARLINTNFGEGDIFATLTYRGEVDAKTASKDLTNFLRRVKRWRKKNGLDDLKYIAVTEGNPHKEHHHLIINKMPLDVVADLWGLGKVIPSRLEPGGDYTGLTVYITKQEKESQKRRWRQSKNLAKPEVIIKKLKADRGRKIYPPKGYSVVESYDYYSEGYGAASYMRAVRCGGADYGGTG